MGLPLFDMPITTPERLMLMKKYSKRHYAQDTYHLHHPQMIVLHYTAIGTLEYSLRAFVSDRISLHRKKISPFGAVNVGCHYVVGADGAIFSMLPTTVMARHAVGYNHTSLAIENVGAEWSSLTKLQVESNVDLIYMLVHRHTSIKYLIGHHEYMMIRLPHYKLRNVVDDSYKAPIKVDPGFAFMRDVRKRLKQKYGIVLLR